MDLSSISYRISNTVNDVVQYPSDSPGTSRFVMHFEIPYKEYRSKGSNDIKPDFWFNDDQASITMIQKIIQKAVSQGKSEEKYKIASAPDGDDVLFMEMSMAIPYEYKGDRIFVTDWDITEFLRIAEKELKENY